MLPKLEMMSLGIEKEMMMLGVLVKIAFYQPAG